MEHSTSHSMETLPKNFYLPGEKAAPGLSQLLTDCLATYPYRENSFFTALAGGQMSRPQFISTQHQFYYAVVHFTTPLALVAAAIPTYAERVNIIKNLWEEHGEGNPALTHGSTFQEFLRRLTGDSNVRIHPMEEGVNLFNKSLDGICKSENYLKGVAAIGIIECMFADISSTIGKTVVNRGWIRQEEMIHYALHEELDCIHAEDFFSILRPHLNANEKEIREGLFFGALTFLTLYQNLWERELRR